MKPKLILIILIVVVISGLASYWYYPKSCQISISNSPNLIGTYRGFGLENKPGFLGKNFFRFSIIDTIFEDGFSWVECHGKEEYCKFLGVYANGQKRMEGECWIEVFNSEGELSPNTDKIKWGKYFKPDGTLASEVVEGDGKKTLWSIDGVKLWEVDIENSKMVKYSMWDRQGKLVSSKTVK